MIRFASAVSLAALSLALAGQAWADTVAPGAEEPAPEALAAAGAVSETQLPDVVVTATKRATNLQKTPIAISATSTRRAPSAWKLALKYGSGD